MFINPPEFLRGSFIRFSPTEKGDSKPPSMGAKEIPIAKRFFFQSFSQTRETEAARRAAKKLPVREGITSLRKSVV
jgi:hypothetical protein